MIFVIDENLLGRFSDALASIRVAGNHKIKTVKDYGLKHAKDPRLIARLPKTERCVIVSKDYKMPRVHKDLLIEHKRSVLNIRYGKREKREMNEIIGLMFCNWERIVREIEKDSSCLRVTADLEPVRSPKINISKQYLEQ